MNEIVTTQNQSLQKLLPENLLNELIQLGATLSSIQWRLGDLTNEVILYCKGNKLDIPIMGIYSGISDITGKSVSSVRLYSDIAGFFSQEIRLQYDELPFSHFNLAKIYNTKWKEVLETSRDEFERSGKLVSENRLAFLMQKKNNTLPSNEKPVFANNPPDDVSYAFESASKGFVDREEPDPFMSKVEVLDGEYKKQVTNKLNELLNPIPKLLEELGRIDGRSPIIEAVAMEITRIRSLQEQLVNPERAIYTPVAQMD